MTDHTKALKLAREVASGEGALLYSGVDAQCIAMAVIALHDERDTLRAQLVTTRLAAEANARWQADAAKRETDLLNERRLTQPILAAAIAWRDSFAASRGACAVALEAAVDAWREGK